MTFGNKLKTIRTEKGYSQELLASKIGVRKQTISRYENSEREPNIRTAKRIANALGISLEELAVNEDELNKKIVAKDDDEEVDPVILDLITKLEAAPLPVRNAAIAAALAVLSSDL